MLSGEQKTFAKTTILCNSYTYIQLDTTPNKTINILFCLIISKRNVGYFIPYYFLAVFLNSGKTLLLTMPDNDIFYRFKTSGRGLSTWVV